MSNQLKRIEQINFQVKSFYFFRDISLFSFILSVYLFLFRTVREGIVYLYRAAAVSTTQLNRTATNTCALKECVCVCVWFSLWSLAFAPYSSPIFFCSNLFC